MSRRLLISIKKPKRRPTTKIPPLKPVDKFKSKMNSLMVTKPVSLLLFRRNQLLLQLRKTIKLFHIPHLNHTNKRKNPWKQFSEQLVNKEFGKPPAMLTLLLLKLNIINKLKTRRTQLESPEEFKLTEDSFTTHQLLPSTVFSKDLLPKKKKKKLVKLLTIPHLNLTIKRKNPWKKFLKLSASKEFGKLLAMPTLLLLKLNITNNLRMRRTQSESLEESKLMVVSFTTHQLLPSTVFSRDNHLFKLPKKIQMLYHIHHLNHTNKRKNP